MKYRGNNTKLIEEIELYKKGLEEAYKDIFRELYPRIENAERSLLIDEAFADSLIEFPKPLDTEISLISESCEDNFFISQISSDVNSLTISNDGSIKCDKNLVLDTSCGIIFNDKGAIRYKNCYYSNVDNIPAHLISFIHEYNHFINYALQEKPLIAVSNIAKSHLSRNGYKLHTLSEEEIYNNLSRMYEKKDKVAIKLFNLLPSIWAIDEILALELEKRILRRLELNVSPNLNMILESDFHNYCEKLQRLTDDDFINYLLNWHMQTNGDTFYRNFFMSLNNIRFRKTDIVNFVRRENSRR